MPRFAAWLSGNGNVMVILKPSPPVDQGDAGLGEEFNVHGIEAINLGTHVGQQLC